MVRGRLRVVLVLLAVLGVLGGAWFLRSPAAPATTTTTTTTADTADTPDTDALSPSPPVRSRVMLGEVTDVGGRGIGGAAVDIVIADRVVAHTVADNDGHFSLDMPSAAVDTAVFRAAGYTEVRVPGADLPTMAEAFWSQALARSPDSRVLTVVSGGKPVEGATVFRVDTEAHDPRRGMTPIAALGVSDDSGHVVLPKDAGQLVVAHLAHGAVDVDANADTATLPAPGMVRVTVVDEERRPLAGATVMLWAGLFAKPPADGAPPTMATPTPPTVSALRQLQRRQRPQTTDDDGVVVWPTMVGDVLVDVAKDGFRPISGLEDRARADRPTELLVKLGQSPVVGGVVVDAVTGAPVVGASVTGDVRGAARLQAHTDDDGRFTLGQGEARASSLTVAARGYRTITVGGVDGSRSHLDEVRIEMVPGSGDTVVGIGVSIALDPRGLRVRSLEAGSPAEAAGIVVGDVIVTVDGGAVGTNMDAAVGSIRGTPGTSVELGVEAEDGARRQLTVERAAITVRKPGRHR